LFTVDHIIPIAKGGTNSFDNLALACSHCNRQKGQQVRAIDPESQADVALYNPREASWAEHFRWSADQLKVVGITPTGRATV
jgi:5-methylcytosine-specific restriction endonuclease McrA